MAATLAELASLLNDPNLRAKIAAAVIKTAVSVNFEDPGTSNHANRLAWAKVALSNPDGTATNVLRYVVAANAGLELAAIQGLSDATIQSHTDASLAVFAS